MLIFLLSEIRNYNYIKKMRINKFFLMKSIKLYKSWYSTNYIKKLLINM